MCNYIMGYGGKCENSRKFTANFINAIFNDQNEAPVQIDEDLFSGTRLGSCHAARVRWHISCRPCGTIQSYNPTHSGWIFS